MLAPGKPLPGVSPAPVAGLAPQPKVDPTSAGGKATKPGEVNAAAWGTRIDMAEREHKAFVAEGQAIVKRYRSEAAKAKVRKGKRFNVLFSNTEVLRSALYGKAAKPDVRRRFSDRDPLGQTIAQVVERSLTYFADIGDVDAPIDAAVLDMLLPGRGIVRVEYEPVFGTDETGAPTLDDQKIRDVHVFWEDFLCGPARSWDKVPWIAFRHTPDAAGLKALISKLPPGSTGIGTEDVEKVPLAWTPSVSEDRQVPDDDKRAEVWEVWDKASASRLWIVRGYPEPVRTDPDPYGLDGFWPMARPLTATMTGETIIPRPEFASYEDQADDLDEVTRRISALTKAMKRRGVYNKAIAELRRLATADDNALIPVESWPDLTKGGNGLAQNIEWEDITGLASMLLDLYRQRDMLVTAVYEITGISDVARGASDPDETAAAQQLKASFGSQRIKRRQRVLEGWVRSLYRIKAELLLKHFDPGLLCEIANVPADPALCAALEKATLLTFRVDIETDSTVFQDAATQQKNRSDLVKASTEFFMAWGPMVQANPALLPLAGAYASFATAAFPDARQISDALDQAMASLQQTLSMPKPPDPKTLAEHTKAQAEAQRSQADVAVANINAQAASAQAQAKIQQSQVDMAATAQQAQRDQQKHGLEMQKAAMDAQLSQQELALKVAAIQAEGVEARAVNAGALL